MGADSANWDPRVPLSPLRDDDPGQFGRYRVLGRLGSGGLGDAFLAQSPAGAQPGQASQGKRSGHWVVIKAVRPGVADTDALRARLAREINAISLIKSPFVAGLLEGDLEAERPWFAMEFVPGITLERSVGEEGALRPVDLDRFARSLAEALQAVHAAGVTHRDLKPANIMLSPKGPVLIDFGIADVAGSTRLTQEGASLGTLFWMAPEQVIGEHATPATDVHAWGLVTYFAATGQAPFTGETSVSAMYQVLNTTPTLPPGYPPDLAAAISRALAKDPRRRPTITELLGMLAPPVPHSPQPAVPGAPVVGTGAAGSGPPPNQFWATPQPGSAIPGYAAIPPPPGAPGGVAATPIPAGQPPATPWPAAPAAPPGPAQPQTPWPQQLTPPRTAQPLAAPPLAGQPVPGQPVAGQPGQPMSGGPTWPTPVPGYQPGGPQGYVPEGTAVPLPPRKSHRTRNLAIAGAGVLVVGGIGVALIASLSSNDTPADGPSASASSSATESQSASASATSGTWDQALADYTSYKADKPGQWSKPIAGAGDWTAVAVQGLTGTKSAIQVHTYLATEGATPFWMTGSDIGSTWGGFTDFKYKYVDATGDGADDILVRAKLADGKWTGAVVLPDGNFASFSEDGKEYAGYYDLDFQDGKLVVTSDPNIKFKFNSDTDTFKVTS